MTDNKGRLLLSQNVSDDDPSTWAIASDTLVKQAEQLARANHLLNVTCKKEEKLPNALTVTSGTMKDGNPDRIIETDGQGKVVEGEAVYISLTNNGDHTAHVSAFDINVSGRSRWYRTLMSLQIEHTISALASSGTSRNAGDFL